MKKFKKGFTLIELLVVIAIIGILAAMILVALNTARNKAKDARVQASLSGIRTAAEMFYGTGSTYVGVAADTNVGTYITDISNQGGTASFPQTATSGAYCVQTSLPSGGSMCTDNGGTVRTSPTAATAVCTALVCGGGTIK